MRPRFLPELLATGLDNTRLEVKGNTYKLLILGIRCLETLNLMIIESLCGVHNFRLR